MDELRILKRELTRVNSAYSDLVAYAIISIHMYEEYLMDKASSKDVARAMGDLLKALPTDYAGRKLKKPRKAAKRAPKASSSTKGTPRPFKKRDGHRGDTRDF